jgi:hypothetical protein
MNQRIPFFRRLLMFTRHIAFLFSVALLSIMLELATAPMSARTLSYGNAPYIAFAYILAAAIISHKMKIRQRSAWMLGILAPPLLMQTVFAALSPKESITVTVTLSTLTLTAVYMAIMHFVYVNQMKSWADEDQQIINTIHAEE